uniref:Putative secreted protein n=1 Tax=Anopheles darlingi TaxID=43151 RepID=A0A2M4D483_ANODA
MLELATVAMLLVETITNTSTVQPVVVLSGSQADGRTWQVVVHERRQQRWQEEAQCTINNMVKVFESTVIHVAISNNITMVPVVTPTHATTPKITVRFPARQAVAIMPVSSNISTRRQQVASFLVVVVHGMVVPSRTTIMRYIIIIKVVVLETLVEEAEIITTIITTTLANQWVAVHDLPDRIS